MTSAHSAELQITKEILRFGQYYSTLGSYTSICFILGHEKAGKSLAIDLMSGKKIIEYYDPNVQTNILIEQTNQAREYPILYLQKYQQQTLLLESFTLQRQKQITKENVIKSIYLRQFAKIVQNTSLILVIEQLELQSIFEYIEHFLQLIGIDTQKDKNLDRIIESMNLMITKSQTDQKQAHQDQVKELIEQYGSIVSVKNILQSLLARQKIIEFINKQPEESFSQTIRSKLSSSSKLVYISQELIYKKSLDQLQLFSQDSQSQVIMVLSKVIHLMIEMVEYACDNKTSKVQYDKIAKGLFPDSKNKTNLKIMVEGWNKSGLSKIEFQSIKDNLAEDQPFSQFIKVLITLLGSFQVAKEKTKEDFRQLIGMALFCQKFKPWMSKNVLETLSPIVQKFKKLSRLSNESQKVQKPERPLPKGKAPIKKQGAFLTFTNQLQQNCKQNKDAIQFCYKAIKQKISNQQKQFQYNEIIYHIKLLRELLYKFTMEYRESIFVGEILQLYLLSQNYWEFQIILKEFIRKQYLYSAIFKPIINKLISIKKYAFADLLINQGLKNSFNQDFQALAALKFKLQFYINNQFKNRSEGEDGQQQKREQDKKRTMLFKIQDLLAKMNKSANGGLYLSKDTFKQIIGKKE